MTRKYHAVRYAADGHAGELGDGDVIATGTLDEVREEIGERIGVGAAGLEALRWPGMGDDVEAYHASEEEGCGGYAVREADRGEK